MRPRALTLGVLPRCSWLRYACHVFAAAGPPNAWAWLWHIWSAPASPPRLPVPLGLSATKKLGVGCCGCGACAIKAADPRRTVATAETTIVLVIVISSLYEGRNSNLHRQLPASFGFVLFV